MTRDEKGYIQFHCDWTPAELPVVPAALLDCRERLHRLGLIGVYPDGIGFGNISTRNPVSALETGFLFEPNSGGGRSNRPPLFC